MTLKPKALMTVTCRLSDIIAPSFYEVHQSIKNRKYTHYWLCGGRGSTKSSFAGIELPLTIMRHTQGDAIALRQYETNLRDSVYAQCKWGIDKLGVSEYWRAYHSPMKLVYKPTGQCILFRGADDPLKLKSIKAPTGQFLMTWYEELPELAGMEHIRSINQSLMRGSGESMAIYTMNPPRSINNWVNAEALIPDENRLIHKSTYLSVPCEWLGAQFIREAEHLRDTKPDAYAHEYLGEANGTGGEVFSNITVRSITADERARFDQIRRGIDWGYAVDPFVYGEMHYDKTRRKLYLLDEIYQVGLKNRRAAEMVISKGLVHIPVIADSAEPKSIEELRSFGVNIKGARKGPDSVYYGVKFLQDLEEIIIDPITCPNAAKEFTGYEYDRTRDGLFKAQYPDRNNHWIDTARYALESDMDVRKPRIGRKPTGW